MAEETLRDDGLQVRIMTLMEENKRPMTNVDLAARLDTPMHAINRACRRLVHKAALSVTADKRHPTYHLQPPGIVYPSLALARPVKLIDRNMQPDEPLRPIEYGVNGSSLDA